MIRPDTEPDCHGFWGLPLEGSNFHVLRTCTEGGYDCRSQGEMREKSIQGFIGSENYTLRRIFVVEMRRKKDWKGVTGHPRCKYRVPLCSDEKNSVPQQIIIYCGNFHSDSAKIDSQIRFRSSSCFFNQFIILLFTGNSSPHNNHSGVISRQVLHIFSAVTPESFLEPESIFFIVAISIFVCVANSSSVMPSFSLYFLNLCLEPSASSTRSISGSIINMGSSTSPISQSIFAPVPSQIRFSVV